MSAGSERSLPRMHTEGIRVGPLTTQAGLSDWEFHSSNLPATCIGKITA